MQGQTQKDGPLDITDNFRLSLPPLLQELSPHLAALHLARVRLALATKNGSLGDATYAWCHKCGGLREGLGGAARKRKRRIDALQKVQSELPPSTTSTLPPLDSSSHHGLEKYDKLTFPKSQQRRSLQCTLCGAPFYRPKPNVHVFPSARRTRRLAMEAAETCKNSLSQNNEEKSSDQASATAPLNKLAGANDQAMLSIISALKVESGLRGESMVNVLTRTDSSDTIVDDDKLVDSTPTPAFIDIDVDVDPSITSTTNGIVESTKDFSSTKAITPAPITTASLRPTKPNALFRTPSLVYISSTSPNPPTYPLPTKAAPPEPAGSDSVETHRASPTSQPPAKKRKVKKSGLAKLLAENKERITIQEQQNAGVWGLG